MATRISPNYENQTSKYLKTGTTICGLICENGNTVIVACDSRSTMGPIVASPNCYKLHHLSKNICCAGAGTAADLNQASDFITTKLNLHELNTNRQVSVKTAVQIYTKHLFRYGGHIGCYLCLGGYDSTGAHLYGVWADGSYHEFKYLAEGSGVIGAKPIMEDQWRIDLTREEGIRLARDCILGGIYNDMGSGSRVNVCVIDKNGKEEIRNADITNQRLFSNPDFKGFPTKLEVLSKKVIPIDREEDEEEEKLMELD